MGDTLHDDEESQGSPSFRRVWKRRSGAQGSSNLSLKAMAVLYDAGEPLTKEEIANRLMSRLDAYERDYLEAWQSRRLEQQVRWQAKSRGRPVSFPNNSGKLTANRTIDATLALKRWLTEVFFGRVHKGTLIREGDRYRPGPKSPRVQTMEGALVRFTPEARREMEQADHDRGRTHLVQLEFQRATKNLDFSSLEARAQLLMFLVRHLFVKESKAAFKEWDLKGEFKHLIKISDSPVVKQAVLQLAVDYLAAAPEAKS